MPPPPPWSPPLWQGDSLADSLNGRFRRDPWSLEWSEDGALADAGVLIHVVDGWEDGSAPWAPATRGPGARDMSASIVFAANQVPLKAIPLFSDGLKGIVFRPGLTRIRCGKSVDSAGHCGGWCEPPDVNRPWNEGTDKLCAWRPKEVGQQLQRLSGMQTKFSQLFYNEIIIDAAAWRDQLPGVVEAIYGDRGLHHRFLREFGLDASQLPFLMMNRADWVNPFRIVQ